MDSGETNPDAKGLAIADLDLGVVVMKSDALELDPSALGATFFAAKATAAYAGFVGLGDDFKLEAVDLTLEVNRSSGNSLNNPVIDFKSSFASGFEVPTGNAPVTLDYEDELLGVSSPEVTLQISEFVYVSGGFAFEKGSTVEVDVTGDVLDGTDVSMETMTIGMSDASAFIGVGGPYWTDTNNNGEVDSGETNPDAKGLAIADLDLGVVLMERDTLELDPVVLGTSFIAAKAHAEYAGFVGLGDDLTLEAHDLTLALNQSSGGIPLNNPAINFASSFPDGYEVDTGNAPVKIDFADRLIEAQIGHAIISLAGVVSLDGSLAFSKRDNQQVELTDGTTQTMSIVTLGGRDLYGFAGINGPYRRDTNSDGVIDDSDTVNPDAIGLSLEGVTFGLAILKPEPIALSTYYAMSAEADAARLVGIDGVTAEGTQLKVDVNNVQGLGTVGLTVVDFTKFTGGKLAVATGGVTVDLSFSERLLRASGAVKLDVFDVAHLDGVFDFELDPNSLTAFVTGTATLGPSAAPVVSMDATGLVSLNSDGLAVRLDAELSASPPMMELDAELQVLINTTGEEVTYEVPERLQAAAEMTEFTVPAGAPQFDGSEGDPGFYVVASGSGTLELASVVSLTGEFRFEASAEKVELFVAAQLGIGPFGQYAAAGHVQLRPEGVVGSLAITANGGLDGCGIEMFGVFMLEVNTTSTGQTIRTLDVNPETGDVVGFKNATIAAETVRVLAAGGLTMGDVFTIHGRVDMAYVSGGFNLAFDGTQDLGGFGTISVSGGAQIRDGNFAAYTELGSDVIGITGVTITGDFALVVNTGGSSVTLNGRAIPGDTYLVEIDATVRVLGFNMQGSLTLGEDQGVFGIEIQDLSLDFFHFIDVNVDGYVRSNGQFLFQGEVSIDIGMGPFTLYGGVVVGLTNGSFMGRIYGGVNFSIDLGIFEIDVDLAGLEAKFEIGEFSASAELEITACGITFGGNVGWSWGAPPVIARKVGDILYLNMGVDGWRRGDQYDDVINESYSIFAAEDDAITVYSMGIGQTYAGISKIMVTDAGDGKDFVYIAPNVNADVEIHGGAGNDTLLLTGTGTVHAYGGEGNDMLYGGSAADYLYGDAGYDEIHGQNGNDRLFGGDGGDKLYGEGGDDSLAGGASGDTLDGGDDNDVIASDGGDDRVYGAGGNDSINVSSQEAVVTLSLSGGDGDDVIVIGDQDGSSTITVTGGSGDDIISMPQQTAGKLDVMCGTGEDRIELEVDSTGRSTVLGADTLVIGSLSLEFDSTAELVHLTDNAATTTFATRSGQPMAYGAVSLTVDAAGRIVNDGVTFNIPDGSLRLHSPGLSATLTTAVKDLEVINHGTGTDARIVVREADDLNLIGDGLYTDCGLIDVQLAADDATLTLMSGQIRAASAMQPISLTADDMDFESGEDRISGSGALTLRSTHHAISYRLGSGAETLSGDDRSDDGDDGYLNLSMRDLAALADGFSQIAIGHRFDGDALHPANEMVIGDVEDATVVPGTGLARVVHAALRDNISLSANRIDVQGDAQVPGNVLEMQGRLLQINAVNLHVPMGLPDSGLAARQILMSVEEQALISGWVVADDLIRIIVWGTTGTGAITTYADGPNSLRTDTGSIIRTLNAASLIDIETVKSIKQAAEIEARGAAAQVRVDAASSFQNLQGGIVSTPGTGADLAISAGTHLWIESGSAVMAGAEFDELGTTPSIVGEDAALTLDSAGELWVAGSVTSSGEMALVADESNFDHADFFDTLPGQVLAESAPPDGIAATLDGSEFPDSLRSTFTDNDLSLAGDVTVSTLVTGSRWFVEDDAGGRYVLYLFDATNDGTMDSLRIMEPHYLVGQRGFSFLLTGTLTVMQDETDLNLYTSDDLIVRGNINVSGTGGDLTLQSNKWVYLEGRVNVAGNLSVYGGVELAGTDWSGADRNGSSIYVSDTATLRTSDAGTRITLRGSQDIDLLGAVVAGGSIGESGVTWAGPDSTVAIVAGQQVYVGSGVLATKSVTITAGPAGIDDNRLSAIVATSGGLNATGWTSNNSGGLVQVAAGTDVQLMGNLLSGGTSTQQFNAHGQRIGETIVWSTEISQLRIAAGGQAWIGGMTENSAGISVETGGYLRTSEHIEIVGGENPAGVGVYISAASEVMAVNPAASISIESTGDANIQGALVAGGLIQSVYDASGEYLGRRITTYDGDSTLRIDADSQIRVGLDLKAGRSIDLVGGVDSVEQGVQYSGNGIVLYGSVQMSTWRPGSQINLNAPGPVLLLAPAHTQEIKADDFIVTADGKLGSDVQLTVWLDKVDFEVEAAVTVTAAATAGNTGIEDLMADLQAALDGANWVVTQSDNASHPTGSGYQSDPDDRDFQVKLYDSKLLLASPYVFQLRKGSSNGQLLGFTALADETRTSSLPYTLYAPEAGSTVSIGSPLGENGKLYIAGKVLADAGISLYSGSSNDGVDVELDATGRLETVHAPIALNPGANAVIRGDVLARGTGSDVVINAANSLTLRGNLEADRDIIINAGSIEQPGATSIETYGTGRMKSLGGGGRILITGLNDVSINNPVGPGSVDLSLIRLSSTTGSLTVERESGNIATGGRIQFFGHDVDIAGVVTSSSATPTAGDYEVEVDIDGMALLHGDFSLAGSLRVTAGEILAFDTELDVLASGERLTLEADGDIRLGQVLVADDHPTLPDGQRYMAGVLLRTRDQLSFDAGGALTVSSGSKVVTTADDSRIDIDARDATVVGSLLAGADLDGEGNSIWTGTAARLDIDATGVLTLGGAGIDEYGKDVVRGGTLQATGSVELNVGGQLAMNALSTIRADATGGESLTSASPGTIAIAGDSDVQLAGLIEALNDGSSINISASGLLLIDGLLRADSLVSLAGGTDASGNGVLIQTLVVGADEQRISGGVVTTSTGGTVTIAATGDLVVSGVLGDVTEVDGGSLVPQVGTVIGTSQSGDVIVLGRVVASESIALEGIDVTVAGGTIQASSSGGKILLRAADSVVVTSADGVLPAGDVAAANLVHLLADKVLVYGTVTTAGGGSRSLLNGASEVTVAGDVRSSGDIEVNAGIDPGWSLSKLTSGTLAASDLNGGVVQVLAAGVLDADGNVRIRSGADATVQAVADLGPGLKPAPRPVFVTSSPTVDLITGYTQEAVGTIDVPEISWVTTTVTEQVGMEEVKIGNQWNTMDVTLTQYGYFNPRASASAQFREWFIEGVDYYNSSDFPHAKLGIPVVNWSAYGINSVPSSDYRQDTYKTFNQLSDDQRTAVLKTLGYMPVYDFGYANPVHHQVIDGVPTEQTWVPAWAGNEELVYFIDVAGWNDKYIRMPLGANEDVLRVTSQGAPATSYESVGQYRDQAEVLYTQDKSDHQSLSQTYYRESDYDNSDARWAVSYNRDGHRVFSLVDGRSGANAVSSSRVPNWSWQSTGSEANVYDNPTGAADAVAGTYGTGRYVLVPTGYRSDTASVTSVSLHDSHSERVGSAEDRKFDIDIWWTQAFISIDTEDGAEEEWALVWAGVSGNVGFAQYGWGGGGDNGWYDFNWKIWSGTLEHGDQVYLRGMIREDDGGGDWVLSDDDDIFLDSSGWYTVPESGSTGYAYANPGSADIHFRLDSTPNWYLNHYINETFHDYTYDWTSIWHSISDKRLTLNYSWTSTSEDLYGKRPRYETHDVQTKVVQDKTITLWNSQPVIEKQSLIVSSRAAGAGTQLPYGVFAGQSLNAGGGIDIEASQDVTIRAKAQAVGGSFQIAAGVDVEIDGAVPGGAANPLTLAADAELLAGNGIAFTAGGSITIGSSSLLEVDENAADGVIELQAGGQLAVSGTVRSPIEISISAGGDVAVGGLMDAGQLIDVSAGQGSSRTGDIISGAYADLQATESGGDIRLTAGAISGSITLDQSALTAADRVELTASAGAISQSLGLIDASLLRARAESGFEAFVAGNSIDAQISGAGAITIISQGSLELVDVRTADGPIHVEARGQLTATHVETLGESDANDITLRTLSLGGDPVNLIMGTVAVGGDGDLTLDVQGAISGAGGTITAAALNVKVWTSLDLLTDVESLSLQTRDPGSVAITQQGTRTLTLSEVSVRDGSLTVNHAGGSVVLEKVDLWENSDANDLTVTAGGDIEVGWVRAGMYYTSAADVPEPGADALAGVSSLGDIALIAGGSVREFGSDSGVDLVADQLIISSQTGIFGLESAVNELPSVTTVAGDIELTDADGAGEVFQGVRLTDVWTQDGSVTIAAANYLEVHHVLAGGDEGIVRLSSSGGNLTVLQPLSGDAIEAGSGVAVSAAGILNSYAFFTAPDLIEYHALTFDFNGDNDGQGLPDALTSATVILDQKSGLQINQPLVVEADRLELLSDANIFIAADVSGTIGTLAIKSLGTRTVHSQVYDESTGQMQWVDQDSGIINVQASQLAGTTWDLRAPREIYVDLSGDLAVTGFVGGLTGTNSAALVTLHSAQALTLNHGTVSAATVELSGQSLTADFISRILASRLELQSAGSIRLNTSVDTLVAETTGAGNIVLAESDAVVLERIVAFDGAITVAAMGDLTALDVEALTDGTGNDIRLSSSGTIYADYVDAGKKAGVYREASQVILDALESIREPANHIDNVAKQGVTMVDVLAWKISLLHGEAMPTPVLIGQGSQGGTCDELEILFTSAQGLTEGPTTVGTIPSYVDGDYVLFAPGYIGNIEIAVTGSLVVMLLPTFDGQIIKLSAGDDMQVMDELNAGSGMIQLAAGGTFETQQMLTAGSLTITADAQVGTLLTTVETLDLKVTGANQDFLVRETDGLNITSATLSGGDLSVAAGGEVLLSGSVSGMMDLDLSAGGSITNLVGASLSVSGHANLSGTSIDLGNQAGDTVNFGSLTFKCGGSVRISEDSATLLTGANTAGSLVLGSTADIDDSAGASLTVTDNASFRGTSIHLGSQAGGALNLGSLTFACSGDVSISEDSSTQLSGANSAVSLIVISSAEIIDSAGGSLAVTDNASLSGTSINLGNQTGDSVNFGSLTFSSGGAVNISEDSGTQLIGTSTAGSAAIISTAGIANSSGAGLTVANNASLTGTSISLGAQSGDTINFGSLTVTSTGAVSVTEDSSLVLVGTNAAGSATLAASPGSVTIDGTLTASASVALTAGGSANDVTINAYVTGANGPVTVTAADNVVMAATGRLLSTGGTITVTADASDGALGGEILMADDARIDSGSGSIDLAADGRIVLGSLLTTGEARVTSDNGAIIDAGTSEPNIRAASLALRAKTGIGDAGDTNGAIETVTSGSALTLAAVTESGDIQITNTGALTVGTVDGLSGIAILDAVNNHLEDAIVITTASPLIVNAAVLNQDGGNITLAAGGSVAADDLTMNANITASGGNGSIRVYAGDSISLTGSSVISAAGSGSVLIMAGTDYHGGTPINGGSSGDVTLATGAAVRSANGNITIRAPGNVYVSTVNANSNDDASLGDVIITADYAGIGGGLSDLQGAIFDNLNGEAANITADQVALRAGSGIGSGTSPDTMDLDMAAVTLIGTTASGDFHVRDLNGGLTVAAFDGLSQLGVTNADGTAGGSNHVTLRSSTWLTVTAGVTVLNADGGNITLAAEGTTAADDLTLSGTVTATGGSGIVSLYAGDSVAWTGTATVSNLGSGAVWIKAGTDHHDGSPRNGTAGGNVLMASAAALRTASGNITILAPGNIGLSVVNADSDGVATSGNVQVWADWDGELGGLSDNVGAISDTSSDEAANITGDDLVLRAATGLGVGEAPDAGDLDTVVAQVAAVTRTGCINIQDLSGGLTIGTVDGLSGVTINNGDGTASGSDHITVRSSTWLTLAADITVANLDGGNITLSAGGKAATDDLTLDGTVTASGGSGIINLYAGDSILLTNDALVDNAGTGEVVASAGTDFQDGTLKNGSAAGDVLMDSDTNLQTASGDITIRAPGNLGVSAVNANSDNDDSVGDVSATSDWEGPEGGLSDGSGGLVDASIGEAPMFIALALGLKSASGLGIGEPHNDGDLDIDVVRLAATTVKGCINIEDVFGGLTIGVVNDLTGLTITNLDAIPTGLDHISVRSSSWLTVELLSPIINADGGNITLAAEGSTDSSDLTLNSNVMATGGNGIVRLYAGDDLYMNGMVLISTSGLGSVVAAAGTNYHDSNAVNGVASGDLIMADGTLVQTAGGNITFLAPGNISLSAVYAYDEALGKLGKVTIWADYPGVQNGLSDYEGTITDNLTGEFLNVIGNNVVLNSGNGIGGPDDEDIDTWAVTLNTLTAVGLVYAYNLNGDQTILTSGEFTNVSGTVGPPSGVTVSITAAPNGSMILMRQPGGNNFADGTSIDQFSLWGDANSYVTVTASGGTVMSTDSSGAPGFQVLLSPSGTGSFALKHPALEGVVTISVFSMAGTQLVQTDVAYGATPANEAPVQTGTAPSPVLALEDSASTVGVSLGMSGLSYAPGPLSSNVEGVQSLTYQVTAIPSFITVWNGATQVKAGQLGSRMSLSALRNLKYQTVADANGTGTLVWKVTDNGSPAKTLTESLTLTVAAVNDAPVRVAGSLSGLNIVEDSAGSSAVPLGITSLNYGPGGASDESNQTLICTLTVIPASLRIFKADGTTSVPVGGTLTVTELRGLRYKTTANTPGTGSLTWTVTDSGVPAQSLTESLGVTVTPVNDPPARLTGSLTPISVLEDSANSTAVTLGLTGVTYGPGGGSDEAGQTLTYTLTSVPSHVRLFQQDGTTQVQAGTSLTGAELSGLKYKTLAEISGSAAVAWTVSDNGSPAMTITESLTLTVAAVNDPPARVSGTISAITVEESSRPSPVSLGLSGLAYGPGGGSDESLQQLSCSVTTVPSFVQLFRADGVTAVRAGTTLACADLAGLKFATVTGGTGTGNVVWKVADNGSPARTLTESLAITVVSFNDPPVRTAGTIKAITAKEDGFNTTAATLGLSTLVYGPGGGTDEIGQTLTYAVTAIPSSVLVYKGDGTTRVLAGGSVTGTELKNLKYKTVPNAAGSGVLTWTVTDNGSPNKTLTESLTISVTAVNDAPVRTGGTASPISVLEDSASTAVSLGLSGLTYSPGGGTDEATQTLKFTLTTIPSFVQILRPNGSTAITAGSSVTAADFQGLNYRTVSNAAGTGKLVWTVTDNGSPAQSLTESLAITVTAVNDVPVRTAGAVVPVSVRRDSANTTAVTLGLSGLTYGPGGGTDESRQTLKYTVTSIPDFVKLFKSTGTAVLVNASLSISDLRGLKIKTLSGRTGTGSLTWKVTDSGSPAAVLTESLSITVASPLRPAVAAVGASSAIVTPAALRPIVAAAISRWSSTGIDPADVEQLARVPITIADLSGPGYLGFASSERIVVDDDGAGLGWFVDATPAIDEEFSASVRTSAASVGNPASEQVDLLTVVMHEMGHVLGLGDLDPRADVDQLMTGTLQPGQRRLPAAVSFAESHPAGLGFLLPKTGSACASAPRDRNSEHEGATDRALAETEFPWTAPRPSSINLADFESWRVQTGRLDSLARNGHDHSAAVHDEALSDLLDDLRD